VVSAVIPTWNRRDDLEACLRSVVEQDYANLQIIVVDNASTDGTGDMIASRFPTVELIPNTENVGASRAKNQGTAAGNGEYIWFLDSDVVVPETGALRRMVTALLDHPDVGSVGGELVLRGTTPAGFEKTDIDWDGATRVTALSRDCADLVPCDYVTTANCLVRKEVLRAVGGFDPEYFYLAEDKELGLMITKYGLANAVSFGTSIVHRQSNVSRVYETSHRFHKTRIRFVYKNLGLLRALLLPVIDVMKLARLDRVLCSQAALPPGAERLERAPEGEPPAEALLARVLRKLRRNVNLLWVLPLAYGWNVAHLIPTIAQRRRPTDHLRAMGAAGTEVSAEGDVPGACRPPREAGPQG
jgi:GT2 family glycosyltransferase